MWCVEVNAAVHSEICAVPAERLVIERELLAPLPSLRASIGRLGDPQGGPAVLCPFRIGPLLGAVRLIGEQVRLHVDDGRAGHLSIMAGARRR